MNTNKITIEDIQSYNTKRDELSKLIDAKNNEINILTNKVKKMSDKKRSIEKSISLEHTLRSLPCQTYGSVTFYNLLNENFNQYEAEQFNKIARFIDLIEKTELQYRNLYLKSAEMYTKDVNNNCFDECLSTFDKLQNMYGIMTILTTEIDRDKVKYNKTYNLLEDRGLFLTVNERNINKMLINITGVLYEIKEELNSTLTD